MKSEPIVIERTYPVAIEKVWKAITDPQQMRQWYFPMMEDFKPEPGFTTQFDVVAGDKHYLHIWKVVEAIELKKISYEWKFGDYPGNSLLSMELFEEANGTRLVLTHEKIETFEADKFPELSKGNFVQGWTGLIGTRLKDYLEKTYGPTGDTGMLIRKPAAQVYEAFVNPNITTKFWFTHGSDALEQGKEVTWIWEMYNHRSRVLVKELIPHQKIVIEWGGLNEPRTSVEWQFEALSDEATFVNIIMYGFTGDHESILKQVSGSVGGFCWVLAGLKAYLEHGIQLNLVADRFPFHGKG